MSADDCIKPRDFVIAGLLGGAAIAAFSDAWRDILRLGLADEELSYVLLAPMMIIWLAWVRRGEVRHRALNQSWLGVVILIGGLCLNRYGFIADPVLWRAGAVFALLGALVAGFGGAVARGLSPAAAAFVFLIPVSPTGRYHVAAPLQQMTAESTQWVCDQIGRAHV